MGSLRIISGKAKGRRLRSVPGDTTRPITDRVREALFNIIGSDIEGATLLDLFAGTGSVGIEALSRGAKHVLFIDKNRQPIMTIRANLKDTNLKKTQKSPKQMRLNTSKKPDRNFDYIYVAPRNIMIYETSSN
jgi:16S rRNA (guanine(966)-N(2))-methyltransferase RsmD